jgi:hypothetical protein
MTISHSIVDQPDLTKEIPLHQIKDLVKGYAAILKLSQTDKTGVIRGLSKF